MEASTDQEKLIDSDYGDVLTLDFQARLNFQGKSVEVSEETEGSANLSEEEDDEEEGEEEEEEEEFTFMNGGELPSPVAAEDAFANGQIKAVFPLFNQELLFANDDYSNSIIENLPIRPPVKKVFVETRAENTLATSSSTADDEITGPYCEWSNRKAVEAYQPASKKSNSTGFSKIWRLKEFVGRTNSDGRDAFVFLNNAHPPRHTAKKKPAAAIAEESSAEKPSTRKVKKSEKSKTVALSAHEVYLRSKKKDGERRRPTYLPYRPELVGFFTTLNSGLTKNVHPY